MMGTFKIRKRMHKSFIVMGTLVMEEGWERKSDGNCNRREGRVMK